MHPDYKALIEKRFHVPLPEAGMDKRLPLPEAIARFTRPGMKVHFASTHTRPYGLGYALARHYWKKDARIEASLLNVGETWIALVLGGVLSKAVTTFSGDIWPYPSPNPVMNRYWLEKKIDIEHWSILSFTQRLLAGALGIPFVPTRSVVGSTMAEDNAKRGTYREIDDPFHPGEKVGLVAALHPDVTFLHVPACDVSGNAIITAPLGEGPLSCFAAREGVILSTEKIVPTSYLREHNHLVKVPAHLVKAVVELPYGGHPRGVTNVGA
ncbi:MAG: CoA-transferase, partial [Bdellovibrionota bacterium]